MTNPLFAPSQNVLSLTLQKTELETLQIFDMDIILGALDYPESRFLEDVRQASLIRSSILARKEIK